MSAATIEREIISVSYHSTEAAANSFVVEDTSRGTKIVRGLRIFKVGTFKDSLGIQRTWNAEHLAQMVFNYDLLKGQDILPNVPVRSDHWSGVEGLVGYFDKLSHDSAFLYGDIEFTEPDAFSKWERGTYRSRSLEVGFYETNDEAVYWPVVVGMAFVDIPAVEGLHSHPISKGDSPVSAAGNGDGSDQGAGQQGDPAAAGQQGAANAGAGSGATTPPATGTGAAAVEGQQSGNPAAVTPPAAHGASTVTFTIHGQATSDYAAVQRHITALETAISEARDQVRTEFVEGLATSNRILASDLDDTKAFALGLTSEQWTAWTKTMGGAPTSPLFAQHGNGVSNPDGVGSGQPTDVEIAAETVQQFVYSGMGAEKIKATPSYKKLFAAQPDHPVLAKIA